MAKEVLVIFHHHFDPTWRRCFDRPSRKHGKTVRSYADIEEHVIRAWLRLAVRGYTFSEGQTVVWRKFLERHPATKARLRAEAKAGRLDVLLAGETVQDTNLPSAEGLVRNFLLAQPFYAGFTGADHRGLKLGWLEDAFGNSANYPQVLRGVGAEVACALRYRHCPEPVWVGIDGTRIPLLNAYPETGGFEPQKHAPCEHCRGRGCHTCHGTGLDLLIGFNETALRRMLLAAAKCDGDWSVACFTTEEVLPEPRLPALLAEFNRTHAGTCVFRMADYSDVWARLRRERTALAKMSGEGPSIDLNPAMPGCMVSRIRCKQLTRAVAYELLAAEAALANRSWLKCQASKAPPAFAKAWQNVVFSQFHDAVTGTHIDAAFDEMMDLLADARAIAAPYLPKPRRTHTPRWRTAAKSGRMMLGALAVEYDIHGLQRVTREGVDVFGSWTHYSTQHRPLRIGELVLEADFGDAWGQRIADYPSVEQNATQIALGDYQTAVVTAVDAIRWRGRYDGGDPKVKKLAWTITVRPSSDGQRLDFSLAVDWDTESRRLRAIVPVKAQDPTATYEIPFGFIDRTWDAGKLNYSQWKAWTGEWPTLHWARKKIDEQSGVAILNRGLPCYRWLPGRFDLSLLRSPEWAFCAVESGSYEFWDIDGQRDAGHHLLEFSVWPYCQALDETALTRAGYAYNLPARIDPPFAVEGDVVVTAWKPSEDGKAWILRLQETSGNGTRVCLTFDRPCDVTVANLLEAPQGATKRTAIYRSHLHRHGLLTLRLRPK